MTDKQLCTITRQFRKENTTMEDETLAIAAAHICDTITALTEEVARVRETLERIATIAEMMAKWQAGCYE